MKILVVDDEMDVRDLFLQRFRREIRSGEFVFIFANSGEQALRILEEDYHEAILILSDINMPGMSGLQLLETIRKRFDKQHPVVMMITAYGDDENYKHAFELGANDFLTKPLDFNILKDKLKALE
jgi:CheY-like chemotaxis protein